MNTVENKEYSVAAMVGVDEAIVVPRIHILGCPISILPEYIGISTLEGDEIQRIQTYRLEHRCYAHIPIFGKGRFEVVLYDKRNL